MENRSAMDDFLKSRRVTENNSLGFLLSRVVVAQDPLQRDPLHGVSLRLEDGGFLLTVLTEIERDWKEYCEEERTEVDYTVLSVAQFYRHETGATFLHARDIPICPGCRQRIRKEILSTSAERRYVPHTFATLLREAAKADVRITVNVSHGGHVLMLTYPGREELEVTAEERQRYFEIFEMAIDQFSRESARPLYYKKTYEPGSFSMIGVFGREDIPESHSCECTLRGDSH
jgi:hypothetical protein